MTIEDRRRVDLPRSATGKPSINRLPTGVPGLDEVLGGGLPEYSLTLIAGTPGSGKTTLSHQIMFNVATPERPALHFTVAGEPPLKMLRYQQQFNFFDPDKVGSAIHYVSMTQETLERGLDAALDSVTAEVKRVSPAIVAVDSFHTLARLSAAAADGGRELLRFLQRLGVHLTAWETTTIFVGEYVDAEAPNNPLLSVADGILWLHQTIQRNSGVRKLQVLKMRGQAPLPGLHTMRITADGLHVFPRIIRRPVVDGVAPDKRLSTGEVELDNMLGGGIPAGDSVLVAGPAGSGKSALATQFVGAGLQLGEPAVIVVFEERPNEFLAHAKNRGPDLNLMTHTGLLEVVYLRPLDLSVDEALLEIQAAVARVKAQRLVIDSLSGFELALAPTFRDDFRESLYRMVEVLTGSGVTVFMTVEVPQSFSDLRFSPDLISFLSDDLILQRYVEIEGRVRKVMTVIKMRGSEHSKDLRLYDVTLNGLVVGGTLYDYRGILTGVADRRAPAPLETERLAPPS